MRTGDINERTGVYRPACCGQDIRVAKGEPFPACPACGEAATWVMVKVA